ncbi:transmembrane protein 145 [Brevipalpus obovatus]|uniref:transmembrane protein 145 n=1 Tax=Brevipalpus obovatus TaxID=246614 RepID=UPI003D9F8E2B
MKNCKIVIFFISFVSVTVSLFRLCESKIVEGEMITQQNWAFLSRFCFLSRAGRFRYDVIYPYEYRVQNILLYYDSYTQWPSVYKSSKDCREKESVVSVRNGQVINLTDSYEYSKCHIEELPEIDPNTNETRKYFNCSHFRVFESARERWWYIAVSNCDSDKGLNLKYRLTMTNDDGDSLLRHFSADQFYILHTDFIFTILYYILIAASLFEAYLLNARHLLHVTYKLFLGSIVCQSVGLTLLTVYYVIYANNGMSPEMLRLLGEVFKAASTIIFLMLLILLAKGFTITRARLKHATMVKICLLMSLYTTTYAGIFLYERLHFDPGEVLYIYESWPGYGMIILRLIAWCWFVYAIVFTLMNYPSKSAFFTKLFLLYTIWFISTPIVIIISTFVVPKWMREKITNAVELLIAAHAHVVFFVLTRPSKANKNFPFHVRTTQIDIMSKTGEAGGDTLDHFTHYSYAPTSFTGRDLKRVVFTVASGNQSHGDTNGFSTNATITPNSTLSGIYSTNFNNGNQNLPMTGYSSLPVVDSDSSK